MKSGLAALCAAAVCAAAGFSAAPAVAQTVEPARAQTTTSSTSQSKMKVCADEWNAKKAANEAGSLKYRDFVKECLSRTATAPESAPAPATPAPAAPAPAPGATMATPPAAQPPAARPPAGPRTATPAAPTAPAAPTTTAPAAPGAPVFPTAVSPKYSGESAGRARMHTCLDQYNANKATNGNGGLNWIKTGGGYYSECNKRLKG